MKAADGSCPHRLAVRPQTVSTIQAKAAQQSLGPAEVESAHRDSQTIANALLSGVQIEEKHHYANHHGSHTSYGVFQVHGCHYAVQQ